jgi:hypothetical protein
MPDQTTLAASPSPPSPDSKSSSQSEWSANKHPTHPCRRWSIQVNPQNQPPVWGSTFSLCLPLHNFQWALCNWCCAAGAGAVLVLRGAACCWLLDPHSCSSPSPSPSGLSLVSAFSSFAAGKLSQLRRRGQAKRPRGHSPLDPLRVEPATVELLLIASLKSKPAGTALKQKESVRHRRYRRRTSWGRPPIRRSSTQHSAPAQSPYTPPPPPRRVLAHLGRSGQDSAKACNLQRLSQCGCISEPISGRLQRTACTFRPAPLPFICCKSPVTDPPGLGHWKAVSSLSIHPHPSHCHEPLCFSAVNE